MTTPFNAALVGAADGDPSRTPNVPLQRAYGGTGNTTGAPSGTAAAPAAPSSGDLWYDTAGNLWKQWNGAGWHSRTRPAPPWATGHRTSPSPTCCSPAGRRVQPDVQRCRVHRKQQRHV